MIRRSLRFYRSAYADLPRSTWILAASVLVNRMGTMVLPFLTLYLTKNMGFTATEAGWLLGAAGAGSVVGTWVGGRLCDRHSPRLLQIALLGSVGVLLPFLGLVRDSLGFGIGFFVISMLGDAYRPVNAVAVANSCPPELRARAAALRRLAVNLGVSAAPALGGILASYSYFWLFLIDGATNFLAAVVLLIWLAPDPLRETGEEEDAEPEGRPAKSDRNFLLVVFLLFLLSCVFYQVFSTFLMTLDESYGFDERRIGLLLSLNPLLIVLFEMVLIEAVRRRNPISTTGLGAFLVCAGLALLPYGTTLAWAVIAVCVFTLGEMLAFPLIEGWIANRAHDARRGEYMAWYSSSFAASHIVAPILGMWIWSNWGGFALWNLCGVLGVIIWLGFLYVARCPEPPRHDIVAS